jgi:hypothetical protein
MKRVMVNLDDNAGDLLEQKATAEKRSASSYIALLVEADLRAAGLLAPASPPPALQEFVAQVGAAHATNPAILKPLKATLVRATRGRRSPAAA